MEYKPKQIKSCVFAFRIKTVQFPFTILITLFEVHRISQIYYVIFLLVILHVYLWRFEFFLSIPIIFIGDTALLSLTCFILHIFERYSRNKFAFKAFLKM